LIRESIHAEVITSDGAEGVLGAWPPTYTPLISVMLDARDGGEGGLRCEASGLHPQH
jgi:hypothetical protein